MSDHGPLQLGPAGPSRVDRVIAFCMRNKLVVFLSVTLLVLIGVGVAPFGWDLGLFPRSPIAVDAIPDIGENQQIVFTDWPGRSPQDVENQVTYPLTSALLGTPGVKTVRSISMFGFSTVYVIFEDNADFYWARTRVLERLTALPANALPEGVRPTLGPDATALGQVFWYTLEGRDPHGRPTGGWDPHELRTAQDWTVRYALQSVPGVSEVASIGGFVQEYQIDVDPDRLQVYNIALDDVIEAVRSSNVDIGARTIEQNRVEYIIRGVGFVKTLADLENIVVTVSDDVPVYVRDVAEVALGPAQRTGALDKAGAEAVGGVVVARFGANPLDVIRRVKERITELAPGLPAKTLPDGTLSRIAIVPFYDRSGLIRETLGTLDSALSQEIVVTILVIVVMTMHLRSALLISGMLPLSVLGAFIAMRLAGVDANIVSLSGIAIAIGTIVDMGIILCENILKHLDELEPGGSRVAAVYAAASEVGSEILTAVGTTIVSFLPIFALEAAEGKLFKPLAYTKTFALIGSLVFALTVIPPAAVLLFRGRARPGLARTLIGVLLGAGGAVLTLFAPWWLAALLVGCGLYQLVVPRLRTRLQNWVGWAGNGLLVLALVALLTQQWLPLGAHRGALRNGLAVLLVVSGFLIFYRLFERAYGGVLHWCLRHKGSFLASQALLILVALYVWLGPRVVFGPLESIPRSAVNATEAQTLTEAGLADRPARGLLWSQTAMRLTRAELQKNLSALNLRHADALAAGWGRSRYLRDLRQKRWDEPDNIGHAPLSTRLLWTLARDWNGLGREFMPPLDEGSYLYMPVTMPHASIGEVQDVLQKQDTALQRIPEVEDVVGKLGRAESALDPAPTAMIETVITYKSEYLVDENGRRLRFDFDQDATDLFRNADGEPVPAPDGQPYVVRGKFARDEHGRLIPAARGRAFRQWRPALDPALNPGRPAWNGVVRPHAQYETGKPAGGPDNLWDLMVQAAQVPGVTSAPKLQPISARLVMLQSGIRAGMGIQVRGPDLETIERTSLEIERLLRDVPAIEPATVIADRNISKPYIEIEIDREAIARYGIKLASVQDTIEVAVGGRPLTYTVEGRQRFPVRVRYQRELRDTPEALSRILVNAPASPSIPVPRQVPLGELARITYVHGPQMIKSEGTFLTGYVLFDRRDGFAEVETVQQARAALENALRRGDLALPAGVSYRLVGSYENQVRAERRLAIIIPLTLAVIFLMLYLHFRSVLVTLMVFVNIIVIWAGGFLMIWLYGQPWFLNCSLAGVDFRELFQVHPIHLSVAVWVGFLALFGIAEDDGVVMATYLRHAHTVNNPHSVADLRAATVAGGRRRVRACLMTTATTVLSLLPVLTSTGRGADVMVPMAIPAFGGMLFEVLTSLTVPTLYCLMQEVRLRRRLTASPAPAPDSARPAERRLPALQPAG